MALVDLAELHTALERETFLVDRASRHWNAPADVPFDTFLKAEGFLGADGTLSLGATLVVSGTVTLPPIERVVRGGMILADAITLQGGIGPTAVGEHLTLVARRGDLTLQTKDPIQASLLAPKGRIAFPEGMDVVGQIVARGIDIGDLEGKDEPSFLAYARDKLKIGPESDDYPLVVDLGETFVRVQ